ncbi:MAG TPA: YhcH/YjgK/YiaL family protein [Pirellulales bacterium]|nr:YhcH/YjgK/YiaL family protein [Pirellulales bacterium]
MILDRLDQAARYEVLHPRFAAAFQYLRRPDLAEIAPGRYEIDGSRLFALVNVDPGRGPKGTRLEVHRRYVDIQVSIDGRERMGWRPLAECRTPAEPYDAARDRALFADEARLWFPLEQGEFALFFPDDAHSGLAADGVLHKMVIKVEL